MIVLFEGLAVTLLILLAVQVIASWRARQDERRERLLAESWAVYHTSRQVHDMTTKALQALLDEARSGRSERP